MGFSFITGQEVIVHADNASFDGTERSGALNTNGELWIGSTALPHVVKNTLTAGAGISITNGPGSITIANTGSMVDLHTARFIVSAGGTADGANYTTIASAITAAVTATGVQTVFIQPGTYTEDLTMAANVNLAAYNCDANTPSVIINGKVTASYTGSASISGICLQTNSDFCVVQSGANACNLQLVNCYISALNNTAISITNSNAASNFFISFCRGDISTTGIAYFAKSGPGKFKIFNSFLLNNGGSSTASTISNVGLDINHCTFSNSIDNSGALPANIGNSGLNNLTSSGTGSFAGAYNTLGVLTLAGTGSATFSNCLFSASTNTAIVVGAGTTANIFSSDISSSNAAAISGAGTLNYSGLSYSSSSSSITVTTQNVLADGPSRTIGSSNSGATNTHTVTNTSNTASSNALQNLTVGGTSAGDPFQTFTVSGTTNWSHGIDNSASDAYVIAASTALGTTNVMTMSTAGAVDVVLENFRTVRSASGTIVTLEVNNMSNTASSDAMLLATVAGSSAGDAYTRYNVNGVTQWAQGVDNSDSDAFVISQDASPGTKNVMRSSTAGEITMPLQPAFFAYLSGSVTDATGDGTSYLILFDTETVDQGGDFNTTTGVFTAPVTGNYQLSYTVALTQLAAHSDLLVQFVTSNLNNIQSTRLNPSTIVQNPTAFTGSLLFNMDAADTASIVVTVSGSTKTVDVQGTGAAGSYFSGFLAC